MTAELKANARDLRASLAESARLAEVAVRWLRDKGSTIPIVALTAHAMSSDLDLCIEAGCNAYASKPIEKAKLIEVCREWGNSQNQTYSLACGKGPPFAKALSSHP